MNNEILKKDLCSRLTHNFKIKDIKYGKIIESQSANNFILGEEFRETFGTTMFTQCFYDSLLKPILFPIRDLSYSIKIEGKTFIPSEEIKKLATEFELNNQDIAYMCIQLITGNYKKIPYWIIELLEKWHINYRLSPEQFIEATTEYI
jgi:hypothetical protein